MVAQVSAVNAELEAAGARVFEAPSSASSATVVRSSGGAGR